MLDMTGLDDGFPVIGEIPKCSDILVCKWRSASIKYLHTVVYGRGRFERKS